MAKKWEIDAYGSGTIIAVEAQTADEAIKLAERQYDAENPFDFGNALSTVASGAAWGGVDELTGFFSKLTGGDYEGGRDAMRRDISVFHARNPKLAFALEVLGGIATGGPLVKLGGLGLKALWARNAAIGGVGGSVAGLGYSEGETPGEIATDVAIGAGAGATLGVALPPAFGFAADKIKSIFKSPNIKIFNEAGEFTDEALKVLDDRVAAGDVTQDQADKILLNAYDEIAEVLTPEQAARFNLFASRGVPITRANVTQSVDDTVAAMEASKRSGPVADRIAEQQQRLAQLGEEVVPTGSVSPTWAEANTRIFRAVDDVVQTMEDAVNTAYASAREVSQNSPAVSLNRFRQKVFGFEDSETVSGGVFSKARGFLKDNNALTIDSAKLSKLTVDEVESIRQRIGSKEMWLSASAEGKRIITELKNALDDDVADAVGVSIFKDARAAKTTMQRVIETARRNSRDKTGRSGGSLLEKIINNQIPEEQIISKVLAGRVDEIEHFLNFLKNSSDPDAFVDLKAQIIKRAVDKATSGTAKLEGGVPAFNTKRFQAQFTTLKEKGKWKLFFNADERAFIDDIVKIGNIIKPVSKGQQGLGPSAMAITGLGRQIAGKIPGTSTASDVLSAIGNYRGDKRVLDPLRNTVEAIERGASEAANEFLMGQSAELAKAKLPLRVIPPIVGQRNELDKMP